MALILIVEDDRDLARVLAFNLRQAGHDVSVCARGRPAIERARAERPELVLLDIGLPDVSGTEVCRTLRADARTAGVAVIMVTGRSEEIDRVVGFEVGADDYVVKPFSVRELLLRIAALLRRIPTRASTPEAPHEFGALRIDRAAHRVWVAGAEVELTAMEFKLLWTLYERKDRVQTRPVLLTDVWGVVADSETRTVDTHVKRLREKLGAAAAYLETVRGVGYRFTLFALGG